MNDGLQKRRAFLEDARGDGSYLRVTWHPEHRSFVLSHWRNSVCTATTQLRAEDAAPLISLLASGLADIAGVPAPTPAPGQPPPASAGQLSPSGPRGWSMRLRAAVDARRHQEPSAPVVPIRPPSDPPNRAAR
jgi:hypothetical protein